MSRPRSAGTPAARHRARRSRAGLPRPAATGGPRHSRPAALVVLTSAAAGGALAAGYGALGRDSIDVEDLALQAFAASTAEIGRSVPDLTLPAVPTPADGPDGGTDGMASLRTVDVQAVVSAATGEARDAAGVWAAAAAEITPSDRGPGGRAGQAASSCPAGTKGFGAVAAEVREAGEQLRCMFAVNTVYGVAGRSNASDHPAGRALDFMASWATGDRLAEYAAANMERLGISYVIYRQRINTGNGWERMEDRGGATANHMDHVHVSFA